MNTFQHMVLGGKGNRDDVGRCKFHLGPHFFVHANWAEKEGNKESCTLEIPPCPLYPCTSFQKISYIKAYKSD